MIIIDYLQLMHGKGEGGGGNREQEIGSISRALKSVAKELDVPVLALSQLSRAVENRPGQNGKRPLLSDLRESGSIEQDADMVLFLYRPEYYGITEDEQGRSQAGVGEVIIAKHRNGETGIVPLRFVGKYVKFQDLEEDFAPQNSFSMDSPGAGLAPSPDFDRSSFGNVIIKPSRMDDMHDEDAPF
jgi:replicative DNA helicase